MKKIKIILNGLLLSISFMTIINIITLFCNIPAILPFTSFSAVRLAFWGFAESKYILIVLAVILSVLLSMVAIGKKATATKMIVLAALFIYFVYDFLSMLYLAFTLYGLWQSPYLLALFIDVAVLILIALNFVNMVHLLKQTKLRQCS